MAKTISYNRLWKMLIVKNMKRQDLKEVSGISTASIAKLGKGDNITTAVLLKICPTSWNWSRNQAKPNKE